MKKCALWMLWIVIAVQTGWMVLQVAKPQQSSGVLGYVGFVTVAFAALAATRGRVRWLATALRIFIGMAFVSAVCDRLGMFGPPGTPGVSWGNFRNFITYTGQVTSFLPAVVIPGLAIVETLIGRSDGPSSL
jgi:hypothetical protein